MGAETGSADALEPSTRCAPHFCRSSGLTGSAALYMSFICLSLSRGPLQIMEVHSSSFNWRHSASCARLCPPTFCHNAHELISARLASALKPLQQHITPRNVSSATAAAPQPPLLLAHPAPPSRSRSPANRRAVASRPSSCRLKPSTCCSLAASAPSNCVLSCSPRASAARRCASATARQCASRHCAAASHSAMRRSRAAKSEAVGVQASPARALRRSRSRPSTLPRHSATVASAAASRGCHSAVAASLPPCCACSS